MNDIQASIIKLLALDVKSADVGFALEKELADPAVLSRGTYSRLVVLLFDNDTRKLFGLDPIKISKDERREIANAMRGSNYLYIAGTGIMARREPTAEHRTYRDDAPRRQPALKAPPVKSAPKPKKESTDAGTAPNVATAILEALGSEGLSQDAIRARDHGIRHPNFMSKRTYRQLLDLEVTLVNDSPRGDWKAAMLVTGVRAVISASPWSLAADGQPVHRNHQVKKDSAGIEPAATEETTLVVEEAPAPIAA